MEQAMKTTSVFCAECICGLHFETPSREFNCPNCKRLIVLEWGVFDDHSDPEISEPTAESEVAA
jgi:hypothetical protein